MNELSIEKNYVVLDVETNGLSSMHNDLLSISIYKPDDEKKYNKFLPLELGKYISNDITKINGITKETLKGATALTQYDVDYIVKEFELDKRIILTYGNLDERFIKNYFKRKQLSGFEKMKFFNFKRNIISSSFSKGGITKDNLCRLYGIDNIQEVHSGINDCVLEWKLFQNIAGKKLLVDNKYNYVYEINNDYIIPVSYLVNYTNFKYHLDYLPKLECDYKPIKQFEIPKIFTTPIFYHYYYRYILLGIKDLLCNMLSDKKVDSKKFLRDNKLRLKLIGQLPTWAGGTPLKKEDLTQKSVDDNEDLGLLENYRKNIAQKIINDEELMDVAEIILEPLIDWIKTTIFKDSEILSEELVISDDGKVLALCDLSNDESVLKILPKNMLNSKKILYQYYYQAKGRKCYVLCTDDENFTMYEVEIREKVSRKK